MATNESIEKIEDLLGSKVGEYIDIADEKLTKMQPLATIYGCEIVTNTISLETIDEYFEKEKDIYSVSRPRFYDYRIQYFGNIDGADDVIKVETTYNSLLHLQTFSQIYSPTFEKLGFNYSKDENGNSLLILAGMSKIHLNKVYNKLKEIGIDIKTEFDVQDSSAKELQKKSNEVKN